MHRRQLLVSSSALSVLMLPGCKTLKALLKEGISDPKVVITAMRVKRIVLDAIDITLDVEIENPNPVGVKLAGVEYDVKLEGKDFVEGETNTPLDLKAEEVAKTSFDVRFPLATLGDNLLLFLQKNEADYVVDAVFKMAVGKAEIGIPGRFEGVVPLPKPPVVEVKNLAVQKFDAAGVTFNLLTRVTNPNVFDLNLDRFQVSMKLNGHDVISNREVAGLKIKPAGVADVPLAFSVSLSGLGLGLAALLERPTLDWALDFHVVSGEADLAFTRSGSIRLAEGSSINDATRVAAGLPESAQGG